jgi:predicted AlkP superfamily phosphohydrolase/phosphomutase
MSQIKAARERSRRLLMLGLDAASLPFIRDNRRRLPILDSLLKTGMVRELESTATYLAASVWPTFSSGMQPGEHGQYFPFQWSAKERRYRPLADPVWSESLDREPFWHRIAKAGIPTIALDVAHALHDERAPCLQITNWSYQSSGGARASDPRVLREIKRRFGGRPIGTEVPVPKTARQCAALQRQLISAVRAKADATIHLMDRPWRLFVTGWYELHRAGHNLWPVEGDFTSDASPDAMLAVYQEADRQLGRVMERLERDEADTSLLLFSLHGMAPNRAQDHFLSEILARLNRLYLGGDVNRSTKAAALNGIAFLRRVVPATLQYHAASFAGGRIQNWVVNRALTGGRDWATTPAFPVLSGGEGLIRLNVKGRESPGYFEPGSRQLGDYVEWLKERLSQIRVIGTGEHLIAEIVSTDELFPGPRRNFLPDLIARWAPEAPVDRISSPDIGEIRVSLATGRGGNHNNSAFLIAKGSEALLEPARAARNIADLAFVANEFFIRQRSDSDS